MEFDQASHNIIYGAVYLWIHSISGECLPQIRNLVPAVCTPISINYETCFFCTYSVKVNTCTYFSIDGLLRQDVYYKDDLLLVLFIVDSRSRTLRPHMLLMKQGYLTSGTPLDN